MKSQMIELERHIFSQNNVIVRLTKIMNRADKNWARFYKIKYFKTQRFQEISLLKVGLLNKYFCLFPIDQWFHGFMPNLRKKSYTVSNGYICCNKSKIGSVVYNVHFVV